MVNVQPYLQTRQLAGAVSKFHTPLLNAIVSPVSPGFPLSTSSGVLKKRYMNLARSSPEFMSVMNIIASDVISDGFSFKAKKGGRNKIIKAEDFAKSNRLKQTLKSILYDILITGEGFGWMGNISNDDLKEVCYRHAERLTKENNKRLGSLLYFKAIKSIYEKQRIFDEDSVLPRKFRQVPSTTMVIENSQTEITGYKQVVGSNIVDYSPEEIIKFELMELDGRVEGFTPMESLITQVVLLGSMWNNMEAFFKNGAQPDRIYKLPKELAGSPNHRMLIDTLKKYKEVRNRHGSLVFTGDLDIEDLQQMDKMQFADLGLYITSVVAFAWGVPVSRIPFLVGRSASGGGAEGSADSAYWRRISESQSLIEDVMNSQLWAPFFGVEMEFNRKYLQDEVRETQVSKLKTDVAEQRIRLGLWSKEAAASFLKIPEEDFGEEEEKQEGTGQLNQNLLNSARVMEEEDRQTRAEGKRAEQLGM